MIKVRLSRLGDKKDPVYRIVAIESKNKREGKPLEILGYWHPASNTKKLNEEKIKDWEGKGAQVTKAVSELR